MCSLVVTHYAVNFSNRQGILGETLQMLCLFQPTTETVVNSLIQCSAPFTAGTLTSRKSQNMEAGYPSTRQLCVRLNYFLTAKASIRRHHHE